MEFESLCPKEQRISADLTLCYVNIIQRYGYYYLVHVALAQQKELLSQAELPDASQIRSLHGHRVHSPPTTVPYCYKLHHKLTWAANMACARVQEIWREITTILHGL